MSGPQAGHVDNVFEKGGPFTKYQILIQISTTFLCLVTSYNNVLSLFTGDSPSWKCRADSNKPFCNKYMNETIGVDDSRFADRCSLNRTDWTFTTDREYSFVTEYDLVCTNTWIAAVVTSMYYVGGAIGCSVSGIASDKFGRKPIILISLVVTSLSLVMSRWVGTMWQLGVLNVIGGAGTYGSFMSSNVYQAEFIPPKYRAISTNILLTGFTFSFFLVDLIAFYVREWRIFSLYVALPSLVSIVTFALLPESPRWLIVKGREEEAEEIIHKITNINPILSQHREEEASGDGSEYYSFLHLFNNLRVLKVTVSIGLIWFMMTIIWYTIALETGSLGGDMYQAFALSNISDVLSYILAVILCSYFGRKKCIMFNFLLTGLLLLILVIVRVSSSTSNYTVNIILTSLARLAINTAAGGIFVWTNEIFPTVLRSRGYFFCALCDRLSVITVPFITRLLQEINPVMPYVISTVLSLCGFLAGFMLPETLNQPTRETYEDFFREDSVGKVKKVMKEVVGADNEAVEGQNEHV